MAQKQKQKRPSPLDEPPTASSSDSEEDQQPSSQQHDNEEEEEEDDDEEASSEEQEEEDDDEEEQQHQPPSKTPPPPPTNSHPKPPSSESDTETDSESDSEPDPPTPSANSKVKPLASKPMEQTPKMKPQPSASATARSASSKRPAENNGHLTDPKRAKKKGTEASDDEAEEDAKKSSDDSKKLFQRLWSEEDEIAILKGMVEFTSKTGSDPFKHANAFHDFMKKSLHVDASSNQLKQKIRRLKKKFETNAGKGKNGEGPSFSKPHDQKAFELSKKVWGDAEGGGGANGGVEKAKSNGKAAKSPKKEGNSRNVAPPKPKPKPKPEPKSELTSMDSKEAGKIDIDEKTDTTSHLMEVIRLDKGVGLSGLNEDVVKRGVELIGASKRAELEEQLKELQVAELELYVKRAELVANQARLILEAYKSSNN